MAVEKNYGAVAKFSNKIDEIAFWDLYRTYMFFYSSEESRLKNTTSMLKRCRKKNINVDFKNVIRKSTEEKVEA
jgi:hypothetical protein